MSDIRFYVARQLMFEVQMHSNIGYIATLCLNLTLLLPLANNPKVDNYVLVL